MVSPGENKYTEKSVIFYKYREKEVQYKCLLKLIIYWVSSNMDVP